MLATLSALPATCPNGLCRPCAPARRPAQEGTDGARAAAPLLAHACLLTACQRCHPLALDLDRQALWRAMLGATCHPPAATQHTGLPQSWLTCCRCPQFVSAPAGGHDV